MATALKLDEQNGIQVVLCPNCSKMYRITDERGQENELPTKCRRCGSPMNPEKALDFANAQAEKDHQPGLTRLANTMRARSNTMAEEPEPVGRRRGA